MTTREKLILVDGSSFLYRAYYADKQGFSTRSGVPTGATFILTRMLKNLVRTYNHNKIIVVFDAKGPSFRQSLFTEYKATRPPMPDDLKSQIEMVHSIVIAMGLPLVQVPGVEADDVLGSYAVDAVNKGMDVIICTGDKDLAQMVSPHITLNDTMKDIQYDEQKVIEKYGVPPSLIVDYLALKGDSADNIPGMKGVGDKTAVALLNGLGGIYQIKERSHEIQNLSFRGAASFAQKFLDQWDNIELSYKLATIKRDVALPIDIDQVVIPQENHDALITIYDNLEFFRFAQEQRERKAKYNALLGQNAVNEQLDDLPPLMLFANASNTNQSPIYKGSHNHSNQISSSSVANNPSSATLLDSIANLKANSDVSNYSSSFCIVDNEEKLLNLSTELNKCHTFALSIEATNHTPLNSHLIGIALSLADNLNYYIPLNHNYLGVGKQIKIDQIRDVINPYLQDNTKTKIAYDLKNIKLVLHLLGFEIKAPYVDLMIAVHTLNSSLSLDLQELADRYLNYSCINPQSIFTHKKIPLESIEINSLAPYAIEKALIIYLLYPIILKELSNVDDLDKIKSIHGTYIGNGSDILKHDMEVLDVLYKMELCGAYLDGNELNTQAKDLKESLHVIEEEIFNITNASFNLSSPIKLGKVLFEDLKIPYPKNDKKIDKNGNRVYSTADDVLSELADEYEVVRKVQQYRTLSKLVSSYADKLPSLICKNTSRIHTRFNLAGTNTGRLSSSEPNLQNIPAKTKEGRQIRKAFCAPQGYKIISADYSQIELRLIAHFSQDQGLINAFNHHQDIHRTTAAEVLGKSLDEVTDVERYHAKATNFGLMYGMSAHGLARQTGMARSEAKLYIEQYFNKYPNIQKLMDNIIAEAKEHGYVLTLLGHRIYIKNIQSSGSVMRAAQRAAINAPMQGSAADIIKLAMVEVQKYIDTLPKNSVNLTLQVHDELIFEVKDELVDEFSHKIKHIMENIIKLLVPLEVGIGVGTSWDDAH